MTQRTVRSSKEHVKQRMKRVKLTCPSCGFRIGDTVPHTRIIIRLAEDNLMEPADLYIKCWRCKSELAARKIE